jgi:hypothetical protein
MKLIPFLGLNVKSMEVWNPKTNAVQVLIDEVPAGVGSPLGLASPQMFPIKNGKEILTFFGYPEVKSAHGEAWRYLVDSNTWTKDATLSHGKYLHVAFPVDGLTC